jgi:hypothetical protein
VEQPFINVEDKIARADNADAASTQALSDAERIAWEKKYCSVRVPRGVYRFRTHEEADEWMNKFIAEQNAK